VYHITSLGGVWQMNGALKISKIGVWVGLALGVMLLARRIVFTSISLSLLSLYTLVDSLIMLTIWCWAVLRFVS